jgi:hypothetical protein
VAPTMTRKARSRRAEVLLPDSQYFLGLGSEARLSASDTNVRRSEACVVGRSHRFEKSHARTALVIGEAIILFLRRMHDIHPALQPFF